LHRAAQQTLRIQLCQLDALRLRREQLNEAIAALETLSRISLEQILRPAPKLLRSSHGLQSLRDVRDDAGAIAS